MSDDIMQQIAKLLNNKTVEPAVTIPSSVPRSEKIRLLRKQLKDGQIVIAHPSVSKLLTKREVKE